MRKFPGLEPRIMATYKQNYKLFAWLMHVPSPFKNLVASDLAFIMAPILFEGIAPAEVMNG